MIKILNENGIDLSKERSQENKNWHIYEIYKFVLAFGKVT